MTILTVNELATWLKLSPSQVYSMTRKRGKVRMQNPLPVLNLNGNLRFSKETVEEWLKRVEERQ